MHRLVIHANLERMLRVDDDGMVGFLQGQRQSKTLVDGYPCFSAPFSYDVQGRIIGFGLSQVTGHSWLAEYRVLADQGFLPTLGHPYFHISGMDCVGAMPSRSAFQVLVQSLLAYNDRLLYQRCRSVHSLL